MKAHEEFKRGERESKKPSGRFIRKYLLLPVLLCLVLLAGCIFNVSLVPQPGPLTEQAVSGEGRSKILLVDVSGLITGREKRGGLAGKTPSTVARIKEELDKAEKDGNIRGVIVRINSPGGTVTASDIIYHELREFRKKKGVPVYAVLMGIGASGGYYASLAADRIFAHPTTITGSIGVIAVKLNFEGLMKKIGVEEKSVKSGKLKDIFSPFRPDTPEERQILETIIGQLHARFVEAVAEGREGRLDRAAVKALADGRPYTAPQALEAKLIDDIGYLEDAVEAMKKSLGIERATVVAYRRPGEYKSTIYSTAPFENSGTINIINMDTDMLSGLSGVEFLYLWRGY
jgi:protease-4